jgi:hypothetical protein
MVIAKLLNLEKLLKNKLINNQTLSQMLRRKKEIQMKITLNYDHTHKHDYKKFEYSRLYLNNIKKSIIINL